MLPGHGRRLTAIFFADVCGYSRLMERNEVATINTVTKLFSQVIAPLIEAFRGRTIQIMGDGVFAEFRSAIDAVACAADLQSALAHSNAHLPPDKRIHLRIGINIGEVVVLDNFIHGTGVNVAARLQAIASEGGISVSRPVYEQVRDIKRYTFRSLGEMSLKNISEPVEVFSIEPPATGSGDYAFAKTIGYKASLSKPSIAVLPFRNLTGDDELDFVCLGITEGINCNLGKFRELLVVARQTTNSLQSHAMSVEQIGKNLGVRYVLNGSVLRAGNRIRVVANLINAISGEYVWTENYDRTLDEVFEVQDNIAQLVAGAMPIGLRQAEFDRLRPMALRNLDAHGALQRGLEQLAQHSESSTNNALKLFDQAIEIDPDDSRAHIAKSRALSHCYWYGWGNDPDQALSGSLEHAVRAQEIDPEDAKPAAALGLANLWLRRHEEAVSWHMKALELNPNDVDVIVGAANALIYSGQPEIALDLLKVAHTLNPAGSEYYHWVSCEAYFSLRDYRSVVAASAAMKDPSELDRLNAVSYAYLGMRDKAQLHADRVMAKHPDFRVLEWAERQPEDPEELDHLVNGFLVAGLPE